MKLLISAQGTVVAAHQNEAHMHTLTTHQNALFAGNLRAKLEALTQGTNPLSSKAQDTLYEACIDLDIEGSKEHQLTRKDMGALNTMLTRIPADERPRVAQATVDALKEEGVSLINDRGQTILPAAHPTGEELATGLENFVARWETKHWNVTQVAASIVGRKDTFNRDIERIIDNLRNKAGYGQTEMSADLLALSDKHGRDAFSEDPKKAADTSAKFLPIAALAQIFNPAHKFASQEGHAVLVHEEQAPVVTTPAATAPEEQPSLIIEEAAAHTGPAIWEGVRNPYNGVAGFVPNDNGDMRNSRTDSVMFGNLEKQRFASFAEQVAALALNRQHTSSSGSGDSHGQLTDYNTPRG